MSLARALASLVLNTRAKDIPQVAFERAKMSLASTIASAAMGYGIESTKIIRELELDLGSSPQSSIWFDHRKLSVSSAARVNAVSSDAAASDDSDLRSIAHIGTIISTCGLAVAERLGASGQDLLEAMVLGYEVAGRIDESLTPGRMTKGFHGSVSTVFAAATCCAKLLRLNEDQLTQAISLAATSIGGMAIAADTSCAREYHAGLSALLGSQAALSAQRGFKAEEEVLELHRGFLFAMGAQETELITKDWGQSWDIVTNMAIKLMPGAHPFHAIAEAAINAAQEGNVDPQQVERIIISAIQMKNWGQESHPIDIVSAAHSVIYFVASCVADKRFSWEHMTQEKMQDPVIYELQSKVVFDPNPQPLPDRFTHHHGGTVIIEMKNGHVFKNTCRAPRGSGPRGIEWSDVENKYKTLTSHFGCSPQTIESSLSIIHDLHKHTNVNALIKELQRKR
jgi:2-methylcitrate dehydratase PrpD